MIADWSYSMRVMIGYVIGMYVWPVAAQPYFVSILGKYTSVSELRSAWSGMAHDSIVFLLKTLNMIGYDSLLRPNKDKKKSSCRHCCEEFQFTRHQLRRQADRQRVVD